jgi:hypothetical protein
MASGISTIGSGGIVMSANNSILNLNGNTTVNGLITLTRGTLYIGSNTLIAKGGISSSSGVLSGSASSNLTLEGTVSESLSFNPNAEKLNFLTLNHTAPVTTTLNTHLDIYGGITFNGPDDILDLNGNNLDPNDQFGGNIQTVLKSNSNGTAYIGEIKGQLNNATNVTVERYIRDNTFRSWRLLSVPTYGSGQTINGAWQEGATNSGATINDPLLTYGTQITSTASKGDLTALQNLGFDDLTPFASMLEYNGSVWNGIANTNATPIETKAGYFIYIRGDRSVGINTAVDANGSITTLRTNGTIYQGTQITPTIPANSYGLVGNIYPSAIDFSSLGRTGGVGNKFYIWDSKIRAGANTLGAYETFDGINGYLPILGTGSYTSANSIIQSGQAFFVPTIASGALIFTEASKAVGNGLSGFRPANPLGSLIKLDSRLYNATSTNTNLADANVVVFDNQYSNAVDGNDAVKFSNGGENFATKRSSKTLVIEGRQALSVKDTIFYNMWNMQQQDYRLEFVPNNLGASGFVAILQDSYLNTETPVDLATTNSVNFTVDANAGSSAANRFRLILTPAAPLPVSFVGLSANQTGNGGVKVDWKVAGETGLRNYEVERSTDVARFSTEVTVKAAGNSTAHDYSWTDLNVPAGTFYYRIKSISLTGEVKYSSIVKVKITSDKQSIVISPNPVAGGVVNLQFSNKAEGRYAIKLSGLSGQAMVSDIINHTGANSANHLLTLPAGMANGTYLLEIVAPDKTKTVQKLIYNTNR